MAEPTPEQLKAIQGLRTKIGFAVNRFLMEAETAGLALEINYVIGIPAPKAAALVATKEE